MAAVARIPDARTPTPRNKGQWPVVSYTQHPVGNRVSVALHVCFLTGAPRRRRRGCCPPFHARIPPATSTDCPAVSDGRGVVIPRPVVRGPIAVALPRSRSPRPFWARNCRPMLIVQERRRVRPMIAPPPSRPLRRSNSDHPGKSTYSGEIDYRFLTFQTGYRFSGSRLTSLN